MSSVSTSNSTPYSVTNFSDSSSTPSSSSSNPPLETTIESLYQTLPKEVEKLSPLIKLLFKIEPQPQIDFKIAIEKAQNDLSLLKFTKLELTTTYASYLYQISAPEDRLRIENLNPETQPLCNLSDDTITQQDLFISAIKQQIKKLETSISLLEINLIQLQNQESRYKILEQIQEQTSSFVKETETLLSYPIVENPLPASLESPSSQLSTIAKTLATIVQNLLNKQQEAYQPAITSIEILQNLLTDNEKELREQNSKLAMVERAIQECTACIEEMRLLNPDQCAKTLSFLRTELIEKQTLLGYVTVRRDLTLKGIQSYKKQIEEKQHQIDRYKCLKKMQCILQQLEENAQLLISPSPQTHNKRHFTEI